jgi:hypothetical protein
MNEEAEGLKEIKRALDEMGAQWMEKVNGVTGLSAGECFRQVKAGQMTITEARIELFEGESEEEVFRFERLMGNAQTVRMDQVENLVEDWTRNQDDGLMVDLAGLMRNQTIPHNAYGRVNATLIIRLTRVTVYSVIHFCVQLFETPEVVVTFLLKGAGVFIE